MVVVELKLNGEIKPMSNKPGDIINVLIVDDIPETRENIKKLLAFEEQEFKVVGSVGTGREAIEAAMETRPTS